MERGMLTWTLAAVLGCTVVLSALLGGCCPPARAVHVQASAPADGPLYIWWEGEDFADTNVPDPDHMEPGDITPEEREILSGGRWFTPRGPAEDGPYWVTYTVEVPEAKTYDFYVRKFWKHGPFRWQFNEGPSGIAGRDVALLDDTFMRQHWGANWVYLGQVELPAGEHTLRVEMLDAGGSGALDAFLLIDGPFMPRGKLKPGQTTGLAEEGYFAWEPPADPLGESPIDLRYLNESQAGVNGFVRREGSRFVLGSGEPVRFWMVQGDAMIDMDPDMQAYWARRLAKYGVNMVRLGMLHMFRQHIDGQADQFAVSLDKLHRLVAALREEGIYVYLGHLYWHTAVSVGERHGFEGFGDSATAMGTEFFHPRMRELMVGFTDTLLNTPNPYTDRPLSREPTVAFVEIQNESSLFFWTFTPQRFPRPTIVRIEQAFGDWVQAKYGSFEAAFEAWGPERYPDTYHGFEQIDHPDEGRLGLYGIGQLTTHSWADDQRNRGRAADQLQFLFETQRGFYRDMVSTFREQLGVQSLITCSNWKTADAANLGVLERLSYTEGDAVLNNVYFDVRYDPRPERFYAVDVGDTYTEFSALKPPAVAEPLTIAHVEDWPYMMTENNWCNPSRYRVEWPFLIATYASMMGADGWCFFALDSSHWQTPKRVWQVNDTVVMGQFPAAALMYRRGDVEEAPLAVADRVSLEDLYNFKGAAMYEMGGNDPLWADEMAQVEGQADATGRVDPLAFFVGRVNREIIDGPSQPETVDLSRYIDRDNQTVASITGQMHWDYGTGVVTVNTPTAQGATGFLAAAGRIELGDVVIESGNEYGSVLVVSLDGEPLARSQRILVQTGTEDKPYGFATEQVDGKQRITSVGGYPLNVRLVEAVVTVRNDSLRQARVLDKLGYPTDRQARTTGAEGFRVELPADSLYTLLEAGR